MKFTYYGSGEEIKVGDYVKVKRFLRSPINGIVSFVYDPQKPSPPKGDNPRGFTVKVSESKFLFFAQAERSIELISRE
jgi:hypothetical protein